VFRMTSRAGLPLTLTALFSFGVAPAAAQTGSIEVLDRGKAQRDGSAVVTVLVTCDNGLEVLEGNLTLSQDDQQIVAQAGIGSPQCDGRTQRVRVSLSPLDASFHAGSASASAFLLLLDPATGTTVQAQDVDTVFLR